MIPWDGPWWIVANSYGGWNAVPADTAADARAWVRDGIAEAYLDDGASQTAARRAASSYGVSVVCGGCTEEEARTAVRAWHNGDGAPAQLLPDRWIAGTRRRRLLIDQLPRT